MSVKHKQIICLKAVEACQIPPDNLTNLTLRGKRAIKIFSYMAKKSFLQNLGICLKDLGRLTTCWVFYNPLSMSVINLLYPKGAARLTKKIFDGEMGVIYTELAMVWPFLWSKYWMTPEQIKTCSAQRQLSYYFNVNPSQETTEVMSEEALEELIKESPEDFVWVIEKGRISERLFSAMLDNIYRGPKYAQLFDEYLRHGTLSKAEFMLLISKAASSSYLWLSDKHPLTKKLLDYVERCGLGNQMLAHLKKVGGTQEFQEEVLVRRKIYEQKLITRRYFNMKNECEVLLWEQFCASEKKIYLAAQKEMSAAQYQIFHKRGHWLQNEAIAHLLINQSDLELKRLIFRNEINLAIRTGEIQTLVESDETLEQLWLQVAEEVQNELEESIKTGERLLSDVEVSKLFACPRVHELFNAYCHRWPELQDKLLQDFVDYQSAIV